MKKNLALILFLVLISAFALSACDKEETCEHTFSEKWSSSADKHWHATTCGHGEVRGNEAAHADSDEDGLCDVCSYELGHTHTFASEWSFDAEKHWKEATCSHTGEVSEEAAHADDDLNGKCDLCLAHTHVLDGAGFCTGCNKEIKPVVETDLLSVASATTARFNNVISGKVEYKNDITSSVSGSVIKSLSHEVEYLFGTNGTSSVRTEDDVDEVTGEPNGEKLVTKKWITALGNGNVSGVTAIYVDGACTNAEPSSFGVDDLRGYYFSASTLADGHGPEALLLVLAELSQAERAENLVVNHDANANTYAFSYDILVINTDTAEGEEDGVGYFEVEVAFSYADDYTLKSLDVKVDCYTNTLEDSKEHDFTYDQETQTITMKADASADTYTFKVTQTVGVRGEIALEDGSTFAPTDFDLYIDEDCANKAENLSLTVGNNDTNLYIGCEPVGTFPSFITKNLDIVVKDSNGNVSVGVLLSITGDVIYVLPMQPGEYVVTFTALGQTKTINASVSGEALPGANKFQVVGTTTYEWADSYTFTADKSGTYTFYAPYGLGIWLESDFDRVPPKIDPSDPYNNATSFSVSLRKDATLTFYYLVYVKDVPYFIGYDYTAPQS